MNNGKPAWWSLFAWPLVGAAFVVSVLGILTIGIYVLPFAFLGLHFLLKWGGSRRGGIAMLSGAGLPLLFIAYNARGGPGMVCGSNKNGGSFCTQEYNPWPWLLAGVALVVAGIVLFLRARGKDEPISELDQVRELEMRPLIAHPLDLPIEGRARKFVASGAVMWTILGSIIAVKGLSTLDRNARPYFIAIIVFAMIVGIGATVFTLRGHRRRAILSLFASIIFPTYFLWVFSLIPIFLAGYLLLSPFITSFRDPQVRRRNIRSLSYLVIAILVFFAWWIFHTDPNASTESRRVQQAFEQMSLTVSNKEGVPTPWLVPMHVGATSYPDGSKASLWVPLSSPQGIRSDCFYLDEQSNGGASGYSDAICMSPGEDWVCTSGMGGQCYQPGKSVDLVRNGSIVVGSVGLLPAHRVSVAANGKTSESPVRNGYFMIPGSLSVGMTTKFTITLLDETGASLGTVTNLQASGWGTPK